MRHLDTVGEKDPVFGFQPADHVDIALLYNGARDQYVLECSLMRWTADVSATPTGSGWYVTLDEDGTPQDTTALPGWLIAAIPNRVPIEDHPVERPATPD